jgi:hypothetical protein
MPCIAAVLLAMQACAPLATHEPRAAMSSLGCMRSAIEEYEPDPQADAQSHCVAAGLIALHCSTGEAWLASIGKELRDLVGSGDAQWRDLKADARGIRCAQSATAHSTLATCCAN